MTFNEYVDLQLAGIKESEMVAVDIKGMSVASLMTAIEIVEITQKMTLSLDTSLMVVTREKRPFRQHLIDQLVGMYECDTRVIDVRGEPLPKVRMTLQSLPDKYSVSAKNGLVSVKLIEASPYNLDTVKMQIWDLPKGMSMVVDGSKEFKNAVRQLHKMYVRRFDFRFRQCDPTKAVHLYRLPDLGDMNAAEAYSRSVGELPDDMEIGDGGKYVKKYQVLG